MSQENVLSGLIEFLRQSPACYHAVESVRAQLQTHGFQELKETDAWNLEPGKCYYVIRGGSSILSFRLPKQAPQCLRLTASHSDSPCFKIKPGRGVVADGLTRLNVERYGGAILQSWFDRPLSIAGRVLLREESRMVSRLLYPDRDLLMIPSLAPHLSNGERETSIQNQMLPILSADGNELALEHVLEECGFSASAVVGMDLFVVCRIEPTIWGANREFLSAPRLDDLACVYGTLQGFLRAEAEEDVLLHCVFDNEEVGSESKQGAASTFLRDVIDRICCAYDLSQDARAAMLAKSFLLSADNAHAAHPGYPAASDPVNRPRMNGGVVLKHQAGQKYTTDGYSAAVVRALCADCDVPLQEYTNHSDLRGGSTLGNISNTQVSLNAADIGLAQLAMHSAFETMGADDPERLAILSQAFYSNPIPILD